MYEETSNNLHLIDLIQNINCINGGEEGRGGERGGGGGRGEGG